MLTLQKCSTLSIFFWAFLIHHKFPQDTTTWQDSLEDLPTQSVVFTVKPLDLWSFERPLFLNKGGKEIRMIMHKLMNDFSFSKGTFSGFMSVLCKIPRIFGLIWHSSSSCSTSSGCGGGGGGGGGGTSSSLIRKFDRLDLWISENGSWPRALAWHELCCPWVSNSNMVGKTVSYCQCVHIGVAAGGWIRVFRAHVGATSCSVRLKIWRLEIKNWLYNGIDKTCSMTNRNYGGFLKWWYEYPTTMGFPTKNDHFGVFWGYHHLRKHPQRPMSQSALIDCFCT